MKSLKLLVTSAALVLGMGSSIAQSQGTVDMSKMTCEDLLKGSGDSIEAAIWLSGYYNGLRKNTKLDLGQFKKNADAVVAECKGSPKVTVMQTVNKMMSKKK
jgi:hypothetical protein